MIRHSELVRYVGTKLLKQEKVKTYLLIITKISRYFLKLAHHNNESMH
jgi:hypothetical protein